MLWCIFQAAAHHRCCECCHDRHPIAGSQCQQLLMASVFVLLLREVVHAASTLAEQVGQGRAMPGIPLASRKSRRRPLTICFLYPTPLASGGRHLLTAQVGVSLCRPVAVAVPAAVEYAAVSIGAAAVSTPRCSKCPSCCSSATARVRAEEAKRASWWWGIAFLRR